MAHLTHRDLTDRLFDELQAREIARTLDEIDTALDYVISDYCDRIIGVRSAITVEMGDRHWHAIEEDVYDFLDIDYDEMVEVIP